MRTSEMLQSALKLAGAITLLLLASTKQFPLTEVLSEPKWQCSPSILMSLVRTFIWAFSDQGRTLIAAAITGVATLRLWRAHPWPEARQLAASILTLVAFLFFIAAQTELSNNLNACGQISASHPAREAGRL